MFIVQNIVMHRRIQKLERAPKGGMTRMVKHAYNWSLGLSLTMVSRGLCLS